MKTDLIFFALLITLLYGSIVRALFAIIKWLPIIAVVMFLAGIYL